MDLAKKLTCVAAAAALIAGPLPASANGKRSGSEPSAGEMTADVLVARPLGVAVTAAGAAAFVVSLPFSLLGGNVKEAGESLVVKPGKATFVRCLGCRTSGRYADSDRQK